MPPIRIFTDNRHYSRGGREELFDLLRPFVGKNADFSSEDRRKMYDVGPDDFRMVRDTTTADIAVLPMSWNYYFQQKTSNEAVQYIESARQKGLHTLSWISGDFGLQIPELADHTVLRQHGFRSELPGNHRGLPVFFQDPFERIPDTPTIRPHKTPPSIGFCGQAHDSLKAKMTAMYRLLFRNIAASKRVGRFERDPVNNPVKLRASWLDELSRDQRITSRFVIRQRYRDGVSTVQEETNSFKEFARNILANDYTLCIRGRGNFSVRLFETLALGRIPFFVDTDGLLPLDSVVNWKSHFCRVEVTDIHHAADCLLDFHGGMPPTDFEGFQKRNRALWLKYLTLGGFFRSIIPDILKSR